MGADLYIEKIHQPLVDKYAPLFDAAVKKRDSLPVNSPRLKSAQREVDRYYDLIYTDGYFRDSYNVTNVLNRMGLSWWKDVTPLCTARGKLQGQNLRRFRDMVAGATLKLPTKEDIERDHGTVADRGVTSLAGWHKYFIGKRAALLSFLDKAIERDSIVRCSL